jgi:ATP phosphoribosyltransferase
LFLKGKIFMENGNLKIAVQKKGRLATKTFELLKLCGIDVENNSEKLIVTAKNFNIDILQLRDDDIPEYVQDGVADFGIVGENVLREKDAECNIVKELGFGKCQLSIAIPENITIDRLDQLNGAKIATSHKKLLADYLHNNNIDANIIEISGSVEIAPSLGIADFICDIVSTGTTLKMNKLKKSFNVFDSQAVLIESKNAFIQNGKLKLKKNLLMRIDSALKAKNSNYLMMNIPIESLDNIIKLIPSLKSPTILPLADKGSLAIHAVIPTETFWDIVDDLKNEGATGILLQPITNIIL